MHVKQTHETLLLDVELKITSPATHRVEVALPLLIGRGGDMLAINRTRSIGKEMFAGDNEKHSLLIDLQLSHCPSGRRKSKRNPKKYLEKSESNQML